MATTTNAENLQYKSSTADTGSSSKHYTNLVKEVRNLSPSFKQIALRCFTLKIILIWTGRSISL